MDYVDIIHVSVINEIREMSQIDLRVASLLLLTSCSVFSPVLLDTTAMLVDARRGTLGISVDGDPPTLGSCVLVDDAVCLTAAHVVGTETEFVVVSLIEKDRAVTTSKATVIRVDSAADLALLKLTNPERFEKQVKLAPQEPRVGDRVFAVGAPDGGIPHVVTDGIISTRTNCKIGGFHCYRTTAMLRPGNSGGAVVDQRGELIGIAHAIRGYIIPVLDSSREVIGIAIPMDPSDNLVIDLPTVKAFLFK